MTSSQRLCELDHRLCYTESVMPTRNAWKELANHFLKNGTRIEFKKDEIVVRPELTPPGVFFVDSGYLKVYELTRGGDENIRTFKQPGNLFPLLWAINGGGRESYTQAITPVVAYRLSRTQYLEYLDSHPQAMRDTLTKMVYLYEAYSDRIHNLEYRYAKERIAYRLLSLAKRYGKKNNGKIDILLPIRQGEFADSINVTRETASRELGKFKKLGLIDYSETKYVILDEAGLDKLY